VTSLSPVQLQNFIDYVNDFHPAIRFTFTVSPNQVNFLDIQLNLSNGHLSSTVFSKETSTHAFVHFDSSHPVATKHGVPYSEFLRLRRLCSEEEEFHTRCAEWMVFFQNRGYPQPIIRQAYAKASAISRPTALQPHDKTENDRPILAITFHPHTLPICRIIRSNWHLLSKSPTVSQIYDKPPLIAYKRDRNLRDMLIHSSLRPGPTITGTVPCAKPKCKACPFITTVTCLQGPKGSFSVRRSFTCQNTNVVYALRCETCNAIYIGETYRSFEVRLAEHLADIQHKRLNYPVASHFCSPGHSASNVQALCLWQCHRQDDLERKLRESNLISRLGTLRPDGLNLMP
jgi:hypothetical protein